MGVGFMGLNKLGLMADGYGLGMSLFCFVLRDPRGGGGEVCRRDYSDSPGAATHPELEYSHIMG